MQEPTLDWQAAALWAELEPLLPGLRMEVVARIASTNSALLERARNEASDRAGDAPQRSATPWFVRRSVESSAFGRRGPNSGFGRRATDLHPSLLIAENQTRGRGRQGKAWQSAVGASLTFSLSLVIDEVDCAGLSLAVGSALADALDPDALTGEQPRRIGVKWPNDLWLLDDAGTGRKLAGILIETAMVGGRRLVVIGVGINVWPMPISDAASGYACLREIDPDVTAPQALARVAKPLAQALVLFQREGFAAFVERYSQRDLLRGRIVRTTMPEAPEGEAIGVGPDGALLLRTPSGVVPVIGGEVSVRAMP